MYANLSMTPQGSHITRLSDDTACMRPWIHGHRLKDSTDLVLPSLSGKHHAKLSQYKAFYKDYKTIQLHCV
jgi:hypothetical protein